MKILQPQNRCFVRGFRQFSAHRTKCHDCHGICTLSPLDAALPMRFTKNTQHDTSKVLRLPRKMTMDTSKVLRLPRNLPRIFAKTSQKYCACHTKRFSTRCRTLLNVTKCHACHAKQSNQTSETSKNDPSCRTSHRHGHTVLTRTVADGCGRLRPQTQTSSEHTLNPQTPRVKREPLLRIWEKLGASGISNPPVAFGKSCFSLTLHQSATSPVLASFCSSSSLWLLASERAVTPPPTH